MTLLYGDDLTAVGTLGLLASEAEVVSWNGRRTPRLVDSLALIPHLEVESLNMGMRSPGNS